MPSTRKSFLGIFWISGSGRHRSRWVAAKVSFAFVSFFFKIVGEDSTEYHQIARLKPVGKEE